jgi:hypothetical protein
MHVLSCDGYISFNVSLSSVIEGTLLVIGNEWRYLRETACYLTMLLVAEIVYH